MIARRTGGPPMRELTRGARFTLRTRATVGIGNVDRDLPRVDRINAGARARIEAGLRRTKTDRQRRRWRRRAKAIAALAPVSHQESDTRAQKDRGDLRAVRGRCRPARTGRAGTSSECAGARAPRAYRQKRRA